MSLVFAVLDCASRAPSGQQVWQACCPNRRRMAAIMGWIGGRCGWEIKGGLGQKADRGEGTTRRSLSVRGWRCRTGHVQPRHP